jgi:hypothetical protein
MPDFLLACLLYFLLSRFSFFLPFCLSASASTSLLFVLFLFFNLQDTSAGVRQGEVAEPQPQQHQLPGMTGISIAYRKKTMMPTQMQITTNSNLHSVL